MNFVNHILKNKEKAITEINWLELQTERYIWYSHVYQIIKNLGHSLH